MPRSHTETILDKYRIHDGHAVTEVNEKLPDFAQLKLMVESVSGEEKILLQKYMLKIRKLILKRVHLIDFLVLN